jgi:mannitol-specific phosphotransferase system IIBC component
MSTICAFILASGAIETIFTLVRKCIDICYRITLLPFHRVLLEDSSIVGANVDC